MEWTRRAWPLKRELGRPVQGCLASGSPSTRSLLKDGNQGVAMRPDCNCSVPGGEHQTSKTTSSICCRNERQAVAQACCEASLWSKAESVALAPIDARGTRGRISATHIALVVSTRLTCCDVRLSTVVAPGKCLISDLHAGGSYPRWAISSHACVRRLSKRNQRGFLRPRSQAD